MMSGSVGVGRVVVPTPGGRVAGGTPAIVVGAGSRRGGVVGGSVGAGVGGGVGGTVAGIVTGTVTGATATMPGRRSSSTGARWSGRATVVGDGKRSSSWAMASPASRRPIDQATIPAITTSASTATMTKPRAVRAFAGVGLFVGLLCGGFGLHGLVHSTSSDRRSRTYLAPFN